MTRTLLVAPQQRGASQSITDALAEVAGSGVATTIRIAPGTYGEAFLLTDAAVRLEPAEGPDTVTIDASSMAHPIFRSRGGQLTLEGLNLVAGAFPGVDAAQTDLTIRGCRVSAGAAPGVTVVGGSVNLRRCTVFGAEYGVVIEEASGVLDECLITDIAADGLICRIAADPTIRSSVIQGCGGAGHLHLSAQSGDRGEL